MDHHTISCCPCPWPWSPFRFGTARSFCQVLDYLTIVGCPCPGLSNQKINNLSRSPFRLWTVQLIFFRLWISMQYYVAQTNKSCFGINTIRTWLLPRPYCPRIILMVSLYGTRSAAAPIFKIMVLLTLGPWGLGCSITRTCASKPSRIIWGQQDLDPNSTDWIQGSVELLIRSSIQSCFGTHTNWLNSGICRALDKIKNKSWFGMQSNLLVELRDLLNSW